jgi:hypothetical protein
MRRAQLSFGDGLIAAEVDDLCEDWMKHADQVLADELLVAAVYEALAKRRHERMVKIAQDKGAADGRRMRVDTTVVETNIHYPTDSSLLGDGVRVLTRTMKKITKIAFSGVSLAAQGTFSCRARL